MAGSRLPQDEYDLRVAKCYEFRFEKEEPYGVKDWLEYCKEHYPEKSQQQHTKMWSDAGDLYEFAWKERLEKLLGPAVLKMEQNLYDEDGRINTKTIDQIFRYSGRDVQKIDANVKGDLTFKVKFGSDSNED